MKGQLSVEMILIGVVLLALVAIVATKVLSTTKNTTAEFESRSNRILNITNFTYYNSNGVKLSLIIDDVNYESAAVN